MSSPPSAMPAPAEPAPDDGVEDARAPAETRRDVLTWVLLVVLYASTATHALAGADSSEWVSILLHGGTPHAPGYPVYALLLRAWGLLPLPFSPAFRAALLSSVLMATAVVVLVRALEERNGHTFTARLAALAFALSAPAWRMAGVAEVSALLCLNVALLLHALHYVENEPELRPWHGAWLGVLLGLGVAHHHTAVFVVPMVLFHVIRGHAPAGARRWTLAVLSGGAAGTLVVALSFVLLHAWEPLPGALHMQRLEDVGDVARSILRLEYGGTSSSALAGGWSAGVAVVPLYELLGAFHVMVPLGMAALQRARGWPPLVGILLAGPWLVGTFTEVGPGGVVSPVSMELRERFHVLPLLLFSVMAHDALASVAYQVPRMKRTVFLRAQVGVLSIAMALAALSAGWRASRSGERLLQDILEVMQRNAPRESIIVVTGDAWRFGTAAMGGVPASTVLAWPRAFRGLEPVSPRERELLEKACGAWPCPGDAIPAALHALAAGGARVLVFPAQAAAFVVPDGQVTVEGLFTRVGGPAVSPAEQLRNLVAYVEQLPLPESVDAGSDAEAQALGAVMAPFVVLADLAHKAGDATTAREADAYARGLAARGRR